MRKITGAFTAMLAVAAMGFATGANAQEPEAPPPVAIEIMPLDLADGQLGGAGGAVLREQIMGAQIVALGEEHGLAESPALGLAIAAAMQESGPAYHVVETGPLSLEWAERRLVAGGTASLGAGLKGRPLALPFLNQAEDAELALAFIDDSGSRLWAVDQEFVGAPLILLEELAQLAPDEEARNAVAEWLEAERAAFADGKPDAVMLFRATTKDFDHLRGLFAGQDRAQAIIDGLAESAPIYQAYGAGKGYDSNALRIALIRALFLSHYRAAPAAAPRVLLKMGAYHLGRGTTPTFMHDLGSLVDGLAAAGGGRSLHIAYMPLGGEQLAMQPSGDGPFTRVPIGDTAVSEIMQTLNADLTPMDGQGLYLIPLSPLRPLMGNRRIRALSQDAQFLLLGFDFLVTTRGALPATPLAE
ncbi:MAG: hypothetical protein R3E02_03950 [Blastomonas sp.]